MIWTYFLLYLFILFPFNLKIVLGQRTFANPAVTDPAPCACDRQATVCDPDCCCDLDCDDNDLSVSPICKSIRTVSSYPSSQEQSLQTWNCSNSTSAALYDYFPFVCVQLKLNEVIGQFYSTDNVTFINSNSEARDLSSILSRDYPELFQTTTLPTATPSTTTVSYTVGAPIQAGSALLKLSGSSVGSFCSENVNVLFGVNRDYTCAPSSNLCTNINSITSVRIGGNSNSNVTITFFTKVFTSLTPSTINPTTEYYFQSSYSQNIGGIPPDATISIDDYCPRRHPPTRIQRYSSACQSTTGCNNTNYQTFSGCPQRDNFAYSTIPSTFFTSIPSLIDDAANFADFDGIGSATAPPIVCTNGIRRVFYRFNYSSVDNTISTAEVFVLTDSSPPNTRITIQWNDIANNPVLNTTVPRSYSDGETLQFRRNNNSSYVSVLAPNSNGYCVDATLKTLRYKQSISSQCFIQLAQSTIQQCHNLKLNMYLYLNIFYAPASDVLAYPSPTATQIPIRDVTQDSLDLDRIDVTRRNNRLNTTFISNTWSIVSTPTIYDATATLPICFDVPTGIYVEFGFVRISISPTVSFERIVSVRYNYTYSNWQFACTAGTCDGTTTQKYLVTFQSAFVDYTNTALQLPDVTRADITSADNYIQHLLWLITPEYKGEPGYRNYTIAMILIFIAISAVVVHALLFGIMCPF